MRKVFLALRLAVVLWAAVAGFSRLPALLAPAPGATATALHTVIGLFAMLATVVLAVRPSERLGGQEVWRYFHRNRAAAFGLQGAVVLALLAAVTPLIAPYDPVAIDVGPHLGPPTAAHWLGTDEFGRDSLSRCLYGARISLVIGFVAVGIASTAGTLLGAVAGFVGGTVDAVAMWVTDLVLSLPRLVLLLAVVGIFRPVGDNRLAVMVVLLGATGWMGVARVVRAQVLALREQEFVLAARALGLPEWRVLLRHVLPNALPPVLVLSSLAVGGTILTEAALSYLGLGVSPPTPTWGALVSEGRESMRTAPWLIVAPGLLIGWTVLSFNLVGEGLRDALDPRMRGGAHDP